MDAEQTNDMPPPGAGRMVALLLAINLFNYLDRYILAAVEPQVSDHFFGAHDHAALGKTGLLATAFLVSYMLLAPVFGGLADRFSRWWIIAGGVAVWSLASGASGLAATFTVLLVTRVFVGIGEAAYGPSAPTIIADLYPVTRRGRMLALFYLAIPVGSALGYAFGGFAGQRWGWRMPFYLVTAPGLILAICAVAMRDPRTLRAERGVVAKNLLPTLREILALFRIRSYTLNTAAMVAMTFSMGGISFWVPHYLATDRAADFGGHPDLGHIGFVFGAITAAAGLLATLLGGWVGDRLRGRFPSAYFIVSGVAIFFAFPATVLMTRVPFPAAWVLIFLAEFFLFFNTGPANTALANVTPPGLRATAFALNILLIHALGDAISPPLIGWIAGRWDMNTAFLAVSATMIVASGFWLLGARHLGRDTAAIEGRS